MIVLLLAAQLSIECPVGTYYTSARATSSLIDEGGCRTKAQRRAADEVFGSNWCGETNLLIGTIVGDSWHVERHLNNWVAGVFDVRVHRWIDGHCVSTHSYTIGVHGIPRNVSRQQFINSWLVVAPLATPGAVRPLTQMQVCSIKWGLDRRHVTETMKQLVAQQYGVPWVDHSKYEFDHLIPRELGGADDVRNLWPEIWSDARIKDKEENRLHRLVCAGALNLHDAQELMRSWGTR